MLPFSWNENKLRNTKLEDESSDVIGSCFCFVWLVTLSPGLLCLPPHGDVTLEKGEGNPGQTAPSLCIEIQLGSVSISSIRFRCPLVAFFCLCCSPGVLNQPQLGFQALEEEIKCCCDMPNHASSSSSPCLCKSIYPILSCHAMLSVPQMAQREINCSSSRGVRSACFSLVGKYTKISFTCMYCSRKNSPGYAATYAFFWVLHWMGRGRGRLLGFRNLPVSALKGKHMDGLLSPCFLGCTQLKSKILQ